MKFFIRFFMIAILVRLYNETLRFYNETLFTSYFVDFLCLSYSRNYLRAFYKKF